MEDRYVGSHKLLVSMAFISHRLYRAVSMTDYPSLEKVAESAIKDRQKFERLVVPKETLLEMFSVCRILPFNDT